jgi:two-component system chemotaxis response regulator CheB
MALSRSEKINFVRPAADPLFESATLVFGHRVLGVVLPGVGRDGARGAQAITRMAGTIIVQHPATAEADAMPSAAAIFDRTQSAALPLSRAMGGRYALAEASLWLQPRR